MVCDDRMGGVQRAMSNAMSQQRSEEPSSTYPCPLCLRTLIPGAAYAPASQATRGTGKVWALTSTERTLVTCERCGGSGQLANRRERRERRQRTDRRG
jgi:hypothetical protein